MGLKQEFMVAVAATQTGIRVNTDELADALDVINDVCKKKGWLLRVWDATAGLQTDDKDSIQLEQPKSAGTGLAGIPTKKPKVPQDLDALESTLYHVQESPLVVKKGEDPIPVVLVIKNFHLTFEGDRDRRHFMVSAIQHLVEHGKEAAKYVVGICTPEANLPPEVEPLFHTISHELPDLEELLDILDGVSVQELTAPDKKKIATAALGLTRLQAEGVFASSLVVNGKIEATDVWKAKCDIINKEGLVELKETSVRFADIGGLEGVKDYILRIVAPDPLDDVEPDARFRGILLVGPPGTGKTYIAYCVGNEIRIVTLLIDVGKLKDQYVGNSEKRQRKMFQIVRRMAPCVAVIDEVNLAIGGNEQGAHSVDKNMLGTFLTNLNDIKEPVFWMFTSNDVENMHEAIFRAGRIDAKFLVRLPTAAQRAVIWKLNIKKFFPAKINGKADPKYIELDLDKALKPFSTTTAAGGEIEVPVEKLAALMMTLPPEERDEAMTTVRTAINDDVGDMIQELIIDDEGWTGAEIAACCRISRRLKKSLFDTARKTANVAKGRKGQKMLTRLERWAEDEGALDSETGDLFTPPEDEAGSDQPKFGKRRRKVRTAKD